MNRMDALTYICYCPSPLGQITMSSDGESLTGLWLEGQRYSLATLGQKVEEKADLPVFDLTRRWLELYFQGQDPGFVPPLRVQGSEFRQMVAQIMLTIPYGETLSYGEIAQEVVRRRGHGRMSSQAVGGAVGHNPISLIIPCHRVIGAKGDLTGYGGGIHRKVWLLQHEHDTRKHSPH